MVTFDEVRTLLLALPGAEEVVVEAWGRSTFRVRDKIFAMSAAESSTVCLKASKESQAELVASDPETFSVAPYVGRHGWVDVALARADRDELAELAEEAWRRTAPARAVAAYDAGRSGARPAGGT